MNIKNILLNRWMKKKSKNYKQCPLFWVTVDLQKLKMYGKKNSCEIMCPVEIQRDKEAVRLIENAVNYIRDNFDLDAIMKF